MSHSMAITFLVAYLTVVSCLPLSEVYEQLEKKKNELKMQQIMKLLEQIPNGIPAKQPALAEYETFKANVMEKFIDDGNGNYVFREFRRTGAGGILNNKKNNWLV